MDYQPRIDRIGELLCPGGVASGDADGTDFLRACLDAGHRKHFFAVHSGGAVLRRRGKTIFDTIENRKLVVKEKAGKDQWQAFCESRDPLSLSAILRIDDSLGVIASSDIDEVRQVTIVGDAPFMLDANCIVPSIFYARPSDVLEYRVEQVAKRDLPRAREKLSQKIFGYQHHRAMEILEKGDNNRHARVTWATVKKMSSVLGEGIEELFTFDPAAGPKNGEQTFALHPRQGNSLAPIPSLPTPAMRVPAA